MRKRSTTSTLRLQALFFSYALARITPVESEGRYAGGTPQTVESDQCGESVPAFNRQPS
jgi:hypothetical protein